MTKTHGRSHISRIFLSMTAGIALIAFHGGPSQAQNPSLMAQATQKVLTPAERAKILEEKRQAWKNRNKGAANPDAVPPAKVIVKKPVVPVAPPKAIVTKPVAPVAPPKAIVTKPVAPAAPPKAIVTKPVAPAAPPKAIVTKPTAPAAPPKAIVTKPAAPAAPPKVIVTTPAAPKVAPNAGSKSPAVVIGKPPVAVPPQTAPAAVQSGPPRSRRWQAVTPQLVKPVTGAAATKATLPANAPLVVRMAKQPRNLNAIKQQRTRTFDRATNQVIIKEPGNRTIIRQNNKAVIIKNDSDRIVRVAKTRSITRSDGTNVTIIQRPNNSSVYNVTDTNGQLVRRYRRDAQGQEQNIIDNRRRDKFGRNLALGVGIGAGVAVGALLLKSIVDVPPPRVDVPRRKYIVDYDQANDEEVYEAFSAPPVERLERRYTLDQVRATPRLREHMRRVDLNDINFDTGSWEVEESQYSKLDRVARAMMRVIDRDANEVFMIEGYTDAVGSENDNLTLSDRRAESVAVILTEQFQVPPENLTTQGFGEEYLKVETDDPERLNRRVALRRITPLLSQNEGEEQPQQ